MAETRDSLAETQRQTRVSVSGYTTVFLVCVAAFTTETDHFFTCFRQIAVSEITYFAIDNVCLCCGSAKFRTGNLLFRSFYWRKREDTVPPTDWFFRVSVRFRHCVDTSKEFHICGNQVFQLAFFFILTGN